MVHIDTSLEVRFHVHYAVTVQDLEVVCEQVADGEWDEDTPAACDACGWLGTVRDLKPYR